MSHSKLANRNAYIAWKARTDTNKYNKDSFIRNKSKIYEREQNNRSKLKDYIIRKYLISSGWQKEDITPELIEIKRQQIILKRNLKLDNKMNATVNGFNYRSDYIFDHANKQITINLIQGRKIVSQRITSIDLSISQLEISATNMLIEYLGQTQLF